MFCYSFRVRAQSTWHISRSTSRRASWNSARGRSRATRSHCHCTTTRTMWTSATTGSQVHGTSLRCPLTWMCTTTPFPRRQTSRSTSPSGGRPSSTQSTWSFPRCSFRFFASWSSICPQRPGKRSRSALAFYSHWLCSSCSCRKSYHPLLWCCRSLPSTCFLHL